MEFKGTKGDWIVNLKHGLETDIFCEDIRIAQAKHYNTGEGDWTKNDPIREVGIANAKLIAAAPDLLEALKSAIPYLEQHSLSIVLEKAEKAINKALEP